MVSASVSDNPGNHDSQLEVKPKCGLTLSMGSYSNQFSAGTSKDDVSHSNHEMVDWDVNQALTVPDEDKGNNTELLKGLSVDDNNCECKCL